MITTLVWDTAKGVAAAQVAAELDYFVSGEGWREVGHGVTDREGRILDFGESAAIGIYRLMFDVASYFPETFFPSVSVVFDVRDPLAHYHVPLLIGPYGYSTYRG